MPAASVPEPGTPGTSGTPGTPGTPGTHRTGLSLTQQILIGLVLGIIVGAIVSRTNPEWASYIRPFSQLFLRMIKMIIAPLIFATLVAGIAGAGHLRTVGRMGIRALIYFEVVTTLALLIGLVAVNITRPGDGVGLPVEKSEIAAKPQTWDQILLHTVPESVIRAMAEGDVLQIVVFSIFFAIALSLLGERGRPIITLCEVLAETMFKFTNIVMRYAPIGVGAAIAYTVGHGGLSILKNLALLVITLYLALAAFILLVLIPVMIIFGIPIRKFIKAVREPAVIAFSTTSSEAALPRALEVVERLGVPRRIVAFVLPLGYSFNLDGSTLYLSLAAVFVAQAANVQLTVGQQITMLLTLMLTSKGVAGVPRASLVILAGTLASYHLPLEGVTLILGVDELMDMGRTMVNVVGNCLATVVVAKWEGEFREVSDEELNAAAARGEV
jgi:proton glutamate symport protein